jgi:hypothetical protein
MAKRRSARLKVTTIGGMRYIEVASQDALALQSYLKGRGLDASPPGPCSAGVDTVHLKGNVATDIIQGFLDQRL